MALSDRLYYGGPPIRVTQKLYFLPSNTYD